jgi:hypothetical protein
MHDTISPLRRDLYQSAKEYRPHRSDDLPAAALAPQQLAALRLYLAGWSRQALAAMYRADASSWIDSQMSEIRELHASGVRVGKLCKRFSLLAAEVNAILGQR